MNRITVTNLSLQNVPLDVALETVKEAVDRSQPRTPIQIKLDLSPTEYKVEDTNEQLDRHIQELITRVSTRFQSNVEKARFPKVDFRAAECTLWYVWKSLLSQMWNVNLFICEENDSVVLRFSPAVLSSRAYEIGEPVLANWREKYPDVSVVELLCDRPDDSFFMMWVEDERILLRIGEPRQLDFFEESTVDSLDGVCRLGQGPQADCMN